MAIPTVVGSVGTANSGTTGAVTYTLPTHATDDILVLFCETNVTAGLTAPSGWAHVTGSPSATAASNVTSANVFWKRATSSSETNPQVAASTNHQGGFAMVFRGCVGSGNPWDVTGSDTAAATTSVSFAGPTTTVADTLVVWALANNTDTATNQFSSIADSTLSSFTTQGQAFTTDGNGGGIAVATGGKATAAATGTLTATIATSSSWAGHVFALKPVTDTIVTAPAAVGSGSITAPGVSTQGPVPAPSVGATGSMAAFAESFVPGPIRRVGTGTVVTQASGTTLAVAYPTVPGGIAVDDGMVLTVFCASTGTMPTIPAGFGGGGTDNLGGTTPSMMVVFKRSVGGESGNVNVTVPNVASKGWIDVYRGVHPTNSTGVGFGGNTSPANSTVSFSTPTATSPNTGLITGVAVNNASVTFTAPTSPAAFTEIRDDSAAPSAESADLSWSGTGSTGTITGTQSGTDPYINYYFKLPAAVWYTPASAGSGSITTPAVTGGVDVVAPAAAGSGSGAVPGVTGGTEVTAPAMVATGSATAPAVTAGADVSAASSASGSITAPAVDAGAEVTAPAASATGSITAPLVALDAIVSAISAGATGSITAPDAGGAAEVSAPAAGASGSATVPALSYGQDIDVPGSAASGGVTAPAISGGADITATAAGATGEMPAPVVNGGVAPNVEVEPPAATATGSAGAPEFTATATIAAPSATGTGSMGLPQPGAMVLITAPVLGATGGAAAPALTAGVNIVSPDASASGSITAPLPQVAKIVLAAAGVATASISAPALSVRADIAALAMLGHGSMGQPRILWTIRDITASATLDARRWQATVEKTWKATL